MSIAMRRLALSTFRWSRQGSFSAPAAALEPIGVSGGELVGTAHNLRTAADIAGTYKAAAAGLTVGGGYPEASSLANWLQSAALYCSAPAADDITELAKRWSFEPNQGIPLSQAPGVGMRDGHATEPQSTSCVISITRREDGLPANHCNGQFRADGK